MTPPTARRSRIRPRRLGRILLIWGLPALLLTPLLVALARPLVAHLRYRPREGDVVFQSLPHSPLIVAIEGATGSPYSHCGLVARRCGRWVVIEAYQGVEETPLLTWLERGRGGAFTACRLRSPHERHAAAMVAAARSMLGRPYDARYRWDDDRIYCSELVAKAFERTAGKPLGRRVRLGDLRWQPYRETIERLEGGTVPLEREMLTPRDLAASAELCEVSRFGY